jgi:hypothetical protein
MPSSAIENVPPIANEIHRLQPKSIVDLGIGFGLYGAVTRQILDGIWGRCRSEQWQANIIGVEIWEAYRNPCWQTYNAVSIGDYRTFPVRGWDLVLMIDSLEHLEPEEGRCFLAGLVERNKHIIVSVPNGPMPQADPVYGNAYERHLTTFYGREFDAHKHTVLHRGLCLVVSITGRG